MYCSCSFAVWKYIVPGQWDRTNTLANFRWRNFVICISWLTYSYSIPNPNLNHNIAVPCQNALWIHCFALTCAQSQNAATFDLHILSAYVSPILRLTAVITCSMLCVQNMFKLRHKRMFQNINFLPQFVCSWVQYQIWALNCGRKFGFGHTCSSRSLSAFWKHNNCS